jgi:hypothetical protein
LSDEEKLTSVNVMVLPETEKFPLCTLPLIEQIILFADIGSKAKPPFFNSYVVLESDKVMLSNVS